MDWQRPYLLFLIVPALATLFWAGRRSLPSMGPRRARLLLGLRCVLASLLILALASPARVDRSGRQSLVFVLDHSQSLGEQGWSRVRTAADSIRRQVGSEVETGVVVTARDSALVAAPGPGKAVDLGRIGPAADPSGTNLAKGIALASAVFPSGRSRHIVLISDGEETEGSLEEAAREAAVQGIRLHTLPLAGDLKSDVRLTRLSPSQPSISEGATVGLEATVQSSFGGKGLLRLFENGIEVDRHELTVTAGVLARHHFQRSPEKRNIYHYRAVLEGFGPGDSLVENNEALAVVDVRGQPLMLYVEGESNEANFLVGAMAKEGIRLDTRAASGIPSQALEIAGYDAIIFSGVPARDIGEARMTAIRDYVEKLGGGFVMIGGPDSFGAGGYQRTPVEEMLPVKLRGDDHEEHQGSALALVIDRSGSMAGSKLELTKSAAIATAQLLDDEDYIAVYAFDSSAHPVLPITRVSGAGDVIGQLTGLSSGGGTNAFPAMVMARQALTSVKSKIKHMIVLTDGQTAGQGYTTLANECQAEGITISTVAIGSGAQISLLQAIAAAGGGKSYVTMDPSAITRIFTEDTLRHTGRLIREEPFQPRQGEEHPMLRNWKAEVSPPLLGYVRTNPKPGAQVPLLTGSGDPLLAHWRFGAGKVTAFSSDCKSRWAALWVNGWEGYTRLWAQILRETARPPQNRNMDLRLEPDGNDLRFKVDLLADAGHRLNNAEVDAEVYFVPANSLGTGLRKLAGMRLEQEGPGAYEATFRPDEPGVYLVRARHGASQVSAGHVHEPAAEVATGQAVREVLESASRLTGGQTLRSASDPLKLDGSGIARHTDLWPHLLAAFFALFLADVLVRRWENAMGILEFALGRGTTSPPQSSASRR
ncbi:MAG: VWA domain-containing protein [Verrucomicrobia bacterium]|nr:VWA domain-containing protein [Verrucomicrobiota bacterium]